MFIDLPACPIYTLLHVLHCSLYIPLGFVLLVFSFDSCCWIVLIVLKAVIMFMSLNKFVILLIIGLKYVNVVHFFDCSFLCFCVSLQFFLFVSFFLRLYIIFLGYTLFIAMVTIVFHSSFLAFSVMGSVHVLVNIYEL